ncbi:7-ethoxycoumarin O-deethylase-like [Durio zibethinus]|uniref:7-ethoxycoumarin O-deethylase-like n=1 Tax=Durio zibethinus TaxID=66656 RepID=A0A6P5YBH1_DURZI|nr:7-ethoxycoumarin O-deethylase-like [Durio zibethinus]
MMSNFYDKLVVPVLACEEGSWPCNGPAALATALAIVCFAWWAQKVITKTKPPLPPGPPGLPILGNLPFIQPDFHQYATKLSQIYGPIIKLQLGRKIWIVISSPSIAKEVLKDHDAIFANRDTPAAALVDTYGGFDIVWRSNGPELHKLRKLVVREIMSNKSLDACYALRRREIRQMIKDIYGKVGSSVDLSEQIFLTTISVMISMLWGDSLNGEERSRLGIEFRKRLEEFVELIGAPNVSDLFPVLAAFDLQGIKSKTKKHLSWFYGIFESVIVHRTKGKKKEGSKDFLEQLLELNQRGDDKTSLSMKEMKALLLDMIIGGSDTTSATVEWAMTELLRHPDKMNRVIEELEKVVGKQNIVEESHLPRLLYLEAVVKETLRIHPAAPLLVPHMPATTCIVSGYTIPKHSTIIFNAWAIQRDPEFWEHPLRFEPERFLKETEKASYLGNDFRFFPFGSGRRICVGIPLAEKMVTHLLAALLHSFEWELPNGVMPDIKDKLGIVLSRVEPLVVIPTARLSNSLSYQ